MDLSSLPPKDLEQALDGPALAPPPGIVSNFDNPVNQNGIAYAVAAVTVTLSSTFFIFRLYSRFFLLKVVKVEDVLVIVAYGLAIGHTWVLVLLAKYPGFFVHQWDVRVRDIPVHIHAVHIAVNLYLGGLLAIKAAIIFEWFRIFNPSKERNSFFWLGHTILIVNSIFYASAILVKNFNCMPQERIWDKSVPGKCIDLESYYIATAAFTVFSDLFIFIWPQKILWRLQMSRSRKIGLSLIFAVAFITCAIAIAGVYLSASYVNSLTGDEVFTGSLITLLTQTETHCSLLVVCIPSTPSVFAKITSILPSTSKSPNKKPPSRIPYRPNSGFLLQPARPGDSGSMGSMDMMNEVSSV